MALRKDIDAEEMALLMFGQFVISAILAAINAGIVGFQLMGGAYVTQPEVIMWYYASASFLVLTFYVLFDWIYFEIFEGNESGGST